MGVRSFFLLGFQFLLHYIKKLSPFSVQRKLSHFLLAYRVDRLYPVSANLNEAITSWQKCTGCNLCDAICPLVGNPINNRAFSLAHLALSEWQDLTTPRSEKLAELLETCPDCQACSTSCPESVDLVALINFFRETDPASTHQLADQ
jgi:succinate dehydrogenase/fumarate reductase-like Fe-S protein